ncbi:precorrin-6y C5,15-methyltransferase (decarboxylating) subunit CbiE [Gordonia amarae]|uniref:Precorrin-6y C5,15-methyltransferase (Decarboxylating) subunit CbiE n=1 Tax=Gordonia amarae TaxID=36821 RepID=A0A857L444_9ACTN|nr:precorrin-6y C5,15-methyltransferase (decarboxylating) subunit CbiE [Gordonia amarae]QHN24336.1 precorrin-6y C5,15-methyltransferase (decarboxylating) subunit CbiE [Gordonia amarae]QHN33259.1 precorrin-6y C5,15-methyltransferase (decarboxylating) subunit CbiE [Gordonia amarae]QHN41979.1 precorrin-6y C5,15-methyltransferase (decarboxylating) subunit CbiE [Gordonia amarae]
MVVGIGEDGWAGLTGTARDALEKADIIYGSPRQLELISAEVNGARTRLHPWRSPMSQHLAEVLDNPPASVVHVLASGDPMFHGVGASIVRRVGADRVAVLPHVSSASLACARLGWDLAGTRIVSAVTGPPEAIVEHVSDGRRILVLSRDEHTPSQVVTILRNHGFGDSRVRILERLGGPAERVIDPGRDDVHPLNIVAVDCRGPRTSAAPGLPDEEYENDGQLTKEPIRALTVCALRPGGRQLLWDVGGGSGSIAIEWLRADADGRAIGFEADPTRAERLARNAVRHGVAHRLQVAGKAPESFTGQGVPDAVFIGGGLSEQVLEQCWDALVPGGRLVANGVAIESQNLLTQAAGVHGGTLRRFSIETAAPLGSLTTWRPALPIVQWVADKSQEQQR